MFSMLLYSAVLSVEPGITGRIPAPPQAVIATDRRAVYEVAILASMHHFARKDEYQYLKALLSKHPEYVDVQLGKVAPEELSTDRHFSLLQIAARRGHTRIVELLLDHRAGVNFATSDGVTALHMAALVGELRVVELLVNRGADLNAMSTSFPAGEVHRANGPSVRPGSSPMIEIQPAFTSYTPLDLAVKYNKKDVVEFLKSKGAKPAPR